MHVIFEAIPIGCPYGPDHALSHSLRPAGPKEYETMFREDSHPLKPPWVLLVGA